MSFVSCYTNVFSMVFFYEFQCPPPTLDSYINNDEEKTGGNCRLKSPVTMDRKSNQSSTHSSLMHISYYLKPMLVAALALHIRQDTRDHGNAMICCGQVL